MSTLATTGHVEVIGYIWMPNNVPCAYSWLDTHAGDFSAIGDFHATIAGAEYGWNDPDSEFTYSDCVFGDEA